MNRKTLVATTVAAVLSTGMMASTMAPVFAASSQTKEAVASKQEKAAEQDYIKVSEDALMTMQNVHGARLALFNGATDQAKQFADSAKTRVAATLKDADKYALDIKDPTKTDDAYVPFDAGLAVAENFTANEQKMKVIANANRHLHKGETKKAVEVLKLGEINVGMTTRLIPLKTATKFINDADKFIADGKYYEANMALKAVEDAVVTETYEINAVPKVKA